MITFEKFLSQNINEAVEGPLLPKNKNGMGILLSDFFEKAGLQTDKISFEITQKYSLFYQFFMKTKLSPKAPIDYSKRTDHLKDKKVSLFSYIIFKYPMKKVQYGSYPNEDLQEYKVTKDRKNLSKMGSLYIYAPEGKSYDEHIRQRMWERNRLLEDDFNDFLSRCCIAAIRYPKFVYWGPEFDTDKTKQYFLWSNEFKCGAGAKIGNIWSGDENHLIMNTFFGIYESDPRQAIFVSLDAFKESKHILESSKFEEQLIIESIRNSGTDFVSGRDEIVYID